MSGISSIQSAKTLWVALPGSPCPAPSSPNFLPRGIGISQLTALGDPLWSCEHTPAGKEFPCKLLCAAHKSLDAAAPGARNPLVTGKFHLLLYQGCSCTSGITHIPPGAQSCPSSNAGVSKGTPSIPKNATTRLSLLLAQLHPCTHSRNPSFIPQDSQENSPSRWQIPLKFPAGAAGPEPGKHGELSLLQRGKLGICRHERALVVPTRLLPVIRSTLCSLFLGGK